MNIQIFTSYCADELQRLVNDYIATMDDSERVVDIRLNSCTHDGSETAYQVMIIYQRI